MTSITVEREEKKQFAYSFDLAWYQIQAKSGLHVYIQSNSYELMENENKREKLAIQNHENFNSFELTLRLSNRTES